MAGIFEELENEDRFIGYIMEELDQAPGRFIEHFPCTSVIDRERVAFAHGEYIQNIKQFSVLLDSKNPDHYKRAGALLHAVYRSNAITHVDFADGPHGSLEEFEAGTVLGYSYGDAQELVKFPVFYKDYHNQIAAFDLAFRCCWAYETRNLAGYDFGFLYNMSHYLWKNDDISVDTCSMLFRAYMHR